jgi:hypothetical protein
MRLEQFDRPPAGWFALDVVRTDPRKWNWLALMVDVDPRGLKSCGCDFPARFYVDADDYRPGERIARQCLVVIPGRHRSARAAWDAIHVAMAAVLH